MENGSGGAPLVTPKRNENAKFKNYDALNEEKEAFGVVVGGREIEFPKLMPAKVILEIERRRAKGEFENEDAQRSFGFQIIEDVIGKKNWEHILANVSVHQAREIVNDMMAYHGFGGSGADKEEEDKDSEARPLEASPSSGSSSTSPSSTETSSGSGPEPGSATGRESSAGTSSSPASRRSRKKARS